MFHLVKNMYNPDIFQNRKYFNPISPCELDNYKLIHYNNITIESFNKLIENYVKNSEIILVTENNKNLYNDVIYKYILKISKNRMVRGYYAIQKIRHKLFINEFSYYVNNHLIMVDHIFTKHASDSFYYVIDNTKLKTLVFLIMIRKKIKSDNIQNILDYIYLKSDNSFLLDTVSGRCIRNNY